MMVGRRSRARTGRASTDQARIGRRAGQAAPRGVSHHALQLHPAHHRQRHRRHQRHLGQPGRGVLRPGFRRAPGAGPARPSICSARCRGALDVSIEQEGPQPQLVIAARPGPLHRYNVRIDDVNRLINTALGGEPVGDAVRRRPAIRHRRQARPQRRDFAPGHRPLAGPHRRRHSRAAGPGGQDRDRRRADDHRPRKRRPPHDRALRHHRPRPGRLRGGSPASASTRRSQDRSRPAITSSGWGCSRTWPGPGKHFLVLIPITIGLIFVTAVGDLPFARGRPLWCCLAVPFACIGGVLALYVRGMHLNMSSAVGFTALFGVAIMDGVLMVRWISTLRGQGMGLEDAIVAGALGTPAADPHDLDRGHLRPACRPRWPPAWAPTCSGRWPR